MKKKINILFVHPIKEFSGSLKSLEEYLKLLKKKYNLFFLVPTGITSSRLTKYGKVINVFGLSKFDNSELGYYRGLRWFLIFRELILLFPTFLSVYLLKKNEKIDIIHFNEVTLLPTIFIFKIFFKVPFILHCRILFKKNNFIGKKIILFIKKTIFQVIAIDNDVKDSLPKSLNIKVVRNLYQLKNQKKRKKLKSKNLNIGYIGSLLKYKGVEDLIKVFENLKKENYKINLLLAGNFIKSNLIFNFFNLSNNIDYSLIKNKKIKYLGHLNNLSKFYNKIDLLCFPSYLNALGRQVIEAGHYEIPSIVCIKKNSSDSFINKVTGLSYVKPGSLKDLENSIKYFYFNQSKINIMGKNAKKLINSNFNPKKNLKVLINIYESALKST